MKQIRRNVFETNSSSTHSISIYKGKIENGSTIPINSKIYSNELLSGYDCKFNDETRKLSHIIRLIASYIDSNCNDCDDIDKMLNLEISKPLKWIVDVVKEVRNTDLIYVKEVNYFPYIDSICDDDYDVEHILNCDINDEESFKQIVKNIIFNPEIIIDDKENEG